MWLIHINMRFEKKVKKRMDVRDKINYQISKI